MGKPGNKNQSNISNIYGRIPGANDISKDRYTDPEIEGLGSPYDQTRWERAKKWASDIKDDPMSLIEAGTSSLTDLAGKAYESTIGKVDTKEERAELWKKGKDFLTKPRPEMQTGGGFGFISNYLKNRKKK